MHIFAMKEARPRTVRNSMGNKPQQHQCLDTYRSQQYNQRNGKYEYNMYMQQRPEDFNGINNGSVNLHLTS